MIGDSFDILARLKAVLPANWFPDQTPVLDAVLTGIATAWTSLYALLTEVQLQSRIATATGSFLDGASQDFFGQGLLRRLLEPDVAFRGRIASELVRQHATRDALNSAVVDLTGVLPVLFEPSRPADTGGYATPGLAYGTAGAFGSMNLPFQVFVTVTRQPSDGIAIIAGYGTPGPLARANLSLVTGQITDLDIYAAIASVMPTGSIAWTHITN